MTKDELRELKPNSIKQRKYRNMVDKIKPWNKYLRYARSRCQRKEGRYFERGIKVFLTDEDLKEIWIRDMAWNLNNPSLDRINGKEHYTRDNCRFIELEDNLAKRSIHNYPKERPWFRKRVAKYDLQGIKIAEFESIMAAQKTIKKGNVYDCYENHKKTAGGFIWKKI